MLNQPMGIAISKDGILYVCEYFNNRVLKIVNINGENIIDVFAGTGLAGTNIFNSNITMIYL
jgi:hypothetical protein